MSQMALYEIWAPQDVIWSNWAKPILFTQIDSIGTASIGTPDPSITEELVMVLANGPRAAVVVNLPGIEALRMALPLARIGFRPVPLFNACKGHPRPAVDVQPMAAELPRLSEALRQVEIPADAPPAFLLDSLRCPRLPPMPGDFDNRWLTFPQDFPSGRFLLDQRVERVLLLQSASLQVQDDLAHVLRRWQEIGLTLQLADPIQGIKVERLDVPRPRGFRSLAYRFAVLFGLRRASVGGFGALVPVPQASHG